MSTTTTSVPRSTTGSARFLWRTTLVAGLIAAAIITGAAAALDAAGVSFEIDGERIPLAAFPQLSFVGAIIGGVLLAVSNRRSHSPRRRFLQTVVALTALSCVPSVALPDEATTKVALVALHLLAAGLVVPALLRHAHE